MDTSTINTVLLMTLIGIIGWIGRRALTQLDRVVAHLNLLNQRTTKLEDRMDVVETQP